MIYEALRSGMESRGSLSVEELVRSIGRRTEELNEQYFGVIITGLMFGATMAIERSASPRTAEQIASGMKAEFLNHIQEQGADAIQKAEWETIIANDFLDYRKCIESYSGFEPPWKLGKEFLWHLLSHEENVAMHIKIATLYLLEGRDVCQALLNEYGPALVVEKSPG